MSSMAAEPPKSSLRGRFKDKLSLSTASIRLPRFLSGEPASPARYQGKPLWTPAEQKEKWYFPPDTPPKQETKQDDPAKRNSASNVLSPQPKRDFPPSQQLDGLLSPRVHSSPQVFFAKNVEPMTSTALRHPLVIRDLRAKAHGSPSNGEPCSRVLQDLIQKIPSAWLTTPKIKEAFIPLLRNNEKPLTEKAPMPSELRLVDGFLEHLPELHIVQQKRVKRKQPTSAAQEYKRSLLLNSELVDEFEKANPRTHVIYAILIIATIINEISTWIIQQLVHSGTISPEDVHPDLPLIVQHGVFGGVLMIEMHADEDPQTGFMDLQGELWGISVGWLLFKYAEGPEGMPFLAEKKFQMRRFGVLRRVGGSDGGLQGSE